MTQRQTTILFCLILIIVSSLFATPKFNRADMMGLSAVTGRTAGGEVSKGDSQWYINYVEFFRGDTSLTATPPPFRYRPLPPAIASVIPIDSPMTALNILNLVSVWVTVILLFAWLIKLGFERRFALLGGLLWAASFPVLYYATDGCVDPVAMAMLMAGILFAYDSRWPGVVAMVLIGSLAKEIVLLLVPLSFVLLWLRGGRWFVIPAIMLAAYWLPVFIVRALVDTGPGYVWAPSLDTLIDNLRFRAFASLGLTFGLPGLLAIVYALKPGPIEHRLRREQTWPLLAGLLFTFALVGFAFVSAYVDGRFMWPATIFVMPFAVDAVRQWRGGQMSG